MTETPSHPEGSEERGGPVPLGQALSEFAARLGEYEAHVAGLVAEHGWALQGVVGDAPAEVFTYTVGMTNRGLPELWLGTLAPTSQGGLIVNTLAARHLEVPLAPGSRVGGEDFNVEFLVRGPVDYRASESFMAGRLGGLPDGQVPAVLQILWPDDEGRYPGDDGYDDERFPQLVLPLAP